MIKIECYDEKWIGWYRNSEVNKHRNTKKKKAEIIEICDGGLEAYSKSIDSLPIACGYRSAKMIGENSSKQRIIID